LVTVDDLKAFAADLRRLTPGNDDDVEALAGKTGLLSSTIRKLIAGDELFSWEVTSLYLQACGVDAGDWRPKWRDLARALDHYWWTESERTTAGPVPDPATADNAAQFAEMLEKLKVAVGNPSYFVLERRAKDQRLSLPHATINEAIKNRKLPRSQIVEAFVRVCGLPSEEVSLWRSEWVRVRDRSAEPPPQPPPQQWKVRWRQVRRLVTSRATRRGVTVVLVSGATAAVLYLIKSSQQSPVYVSLVPAAAVPSSSVNVAFMLPHGGNWDMDMRFSLHNSDAYSDCLARTAIAYTLLAGDGRVLGSGELSSRQRSVPGPIRLSGVDSLRIEATAKAPPPVMTSVPDGCAKLELNVDRVEVRPVVSGWLSWLP
jgi:hypothetical protein